MKIDVILPTYDGEAFLADALGSLLAQTHPDWHLTAVDDGSRDGTLDLLEAFRSAHPERVSLIRNQRTLRAAASRMKAVAASSGELIGFLDQDDRWQPTKLARQVESLRSEPAIHALHTDVEHIDARGQRIDGSAQAENALRRAVGFERQDAEQACRSLFARNSIRLVSALIRRPAFLAAGGFRGELFGGEDWEFWVRFSGRFRIGYLPEALVERRIHGANTSTARVLERTEGLLEALALLEAQEPRVADLCGAKRLELEGRRVLESSQAGLYGQAARAAWRVLTRAPWRPATAAYACVGISGPLGRRLVAAHRKRLADQQGR